MSAKCAVTKSRLRSFPPRGSVKPLLPAALLASACMVLPCHAYAQAGKSALRRDAGATVGPKEAVLKEVVVTAQKRAQNIQIVPESVVAIGAHELAARHMIRIDDLGNVVSDLNITTRFDHTADVVMRGVGAFGVSEGVGFYANGVQLFDGQTVRMNDIKSIEVLKGPQGVLYGGNAIGGAIKFITKLPTSTFQGGATVSYGEYDTRTVSSFASGPLVADSLDARVSMFYTRTGGYIYDKVLGRNVDAGKEYGGRITLEHKTAATTAILYLDADQLLTGEQNTYYRPLSPTDYSYDVAAGTKPSFNRTLYSVTLRLQHELSPTVRVTSISSFFHSGEGGVTDVDKGPFPMLTGYQIYGHRVASEELRFWNRGSGHSKWLIGLFVQANDTPNNYQDSRSFNGNPHNTASYSIARLYSNIYTNGRQTHREYAIFGNEQYDVGAWSFQAGARIDYNRSTMTDSINGISGTQHGTEFMPRASISYHFTPQVMAYSTIARGFEPGDLTEGTGAAGNLVITRYRPETDWSYEAGVKSTIAHRVRLNGDVFYIDYLNRLWQTNRFEAGRFVNMITNIGNSRNYGAELQMDALLGAGFRFNISAGMTRAVWESVPYYDPDLNNKLVNLDGRFAPDTPAYTASLGLAWAHQLSDTAAMGARIDVAAFGRHYWDPTNHYYQPAYSLVNAGVHLQVGNWTVRVHGSNLLNTMYNTAFISAAEVGAPFNVAGIGRPRSWVVSFKYDFQ